MKQSTARNVMIFLADETDPTVGIAGLTPTAELSKDGGAFSSIAPSITDRSNGWYNIALTTTHTNTLGDLVVRVSGTGAIVGEKVFEVVANDVADAVSAIAALSIPTAAVIAAAVWDRLTSALSTSSSIGKLLVDNVNATISSRSTLTAANIWDALTSGLATANSIGKLLVDNINASITSRMATFSYTAPDNSGIAAIQAKTDNLPSDPADQSLIIAAVSAVETKVDTVDTVVDAIKSKTDNLPSDPADQSLLIAATTNIYDRIGAPSGASISADIAGISGGVDVSADVAAIKAKTDNLPAAPAAVGDVTTVGTAVAGVSTKLGTPAGASMSADIVAVKSDTGAVKAKTDNLPSDPADQSLLIAAIGAVETKADAVKAKTDLIPARPARASMVAGQAISGFKFVMRSATTGLPMTGLTVTARRSTIGTPAFSTMDNPVTEISNGWYKIDLSTTDTNSANILSLRFTASGALDTDVTLNLEDAV